MGCAKAQRKVKLKRREKRLLWPGGHLWYYTVSVTTLSALVLQGKWFKNKGWRQEGKGPELLPVWSCVPSAGEAETCSSQKDGEARVLARWGWL